MINITPKVLFPCFPTNMAHFLYLISLSSVIFILRMIMLFLFNLLFIDNFPLNMLNHLHKHIPPTINRMQLHKHLRVPMYAEFKHKPLHFTTSPISLLSPIILWKSQEDKINTNPLVIKRSIQFRLLFQTVDESRHW